MEYDHDTTEHAKAMLARCRRRMTGMEIAMCEKLASMDDDDECAGFSLTREQCGWFTIMRVQFAREIAEWVNRHGRVPA